METLCNNIDQTSHIAVLPLGAYEAHGPHLPFETDALIAQAVVDHVAAILPLHLNVSFLNVEPIGYSIEHKRVSGTKTLSFDEAVARWIKIGEEQFKKGTDKFVLLNAHGGNSPLMTIVATELRARYPMLCVTTSWTRFGLPIGLMSEGEKALDIHAGFIETSVMLHIAPHLVVMEKAKNFSNFQARCHCDFSYLRAYGRHSFGWLMQDLNCEGAAGDASRASAAVGKAILDHAAKGFISLLEDVHRFDTEHFQKIDELFPQST
ncbi:creatininase family protein [Bartonella sp. HY038]|uniref:creatininase family protein n=1 Tax=Bartonella sp. HY038 TaxID=2759660 RepID=UPI0015FAC79B|nr:creatininase family protein [Bartonella sp. HY038]